MLVGVTGKILTVSDFLSMEGETEIFLFQKVMFRLLSSWVLRVTKYYPVWVTFQLSVAPIGVFFFNY